jgi:zinc/manganese transport system substrate-binding protein
MMKTHRMTRTRGRSSPAGAVSLAAAFVAAVVLGPGTALAAKKVKVVATLTVFGDIVRQVGGDHVEVSVLDPPTQDVHFYEPKPTDILRLSKADLFVNAGLDLEQWRGPLVEAVRNRDFFEGGAREVDCSQGIALLEVPTKGTLSRQFGDVHVYGNPHYYTDPSTFPIIAANIARKLAQVDPADAADFQKNLSDFQARLSGAMGRWKATLAPYAGRPLAAYHNTWPYFARTFGLKIDTFLEPKPNIPPSASHLEEVIRTMKEEKIHVILLEPFQHRPYAEQVAHQTGAKVVLVSQTPGGMPNTKGLFAWMDALTTSIADALGSEQKGGT